jgi:type I restriction enzyme S subunit
MKKGWLTKTLSEVCQIKPPKSEARDKVSASSLVSFLPMEDMGIDVKFVQATQTKPLSAVVGSYTYFADGDVLLAKITPCFENGKLGIADGLKNGIGFGSSEYFVFRPDQTVSKEWLYYFLSRETFRVEGAARMSGAVGHKRVSKEFIEEYPIPVPPLAEQQRIVGLLDEAFEGLATAKANAEKNLQNARALFESHHDSIFRHRREGWAEKPLGEVCEYVNGKAHEQCIDEDGRFIVINSKFISTNGEVFKKSMDALLLLQPGEIAMVLSDVPNGKALAKCFLVEEADTYTLNQRICLIRSTKFHTKFLFYQLNRNRHFLSFDNGGNQTNMRLNQVLSCPLFLPALAEQETIADTLDALSEETQRLARIYERKLAALAELKNSLLHQAFTGEL